MVPKGAGVEYKDKERKSAFWSPGREGGGKETPIPFRVLSTQPSLQGSAPWP